jgi:plastocyanin
MKTPIRMPLCSFIPGGTVRRFALLAWLLAAPIVAAHGADAVHSANAAKPSHRTVTIVIEGMKFSPETVQVQKGDTVIWRNKDMFPHTVSTQQRGFTSPEIAPDQSWKFVASDKGTFPYLCSLHTTMKGTLVVK